MNHEQIYVILAFWFVIGSFCGAKANSDPIFLSRTMHPDFGDSLLCNLIIPLFWPFYVIIRFFCK